MQNKYVADVGDFGKYGLLRYLCRDLRLGVAWYLVADEGYNSDGRHIRYLNLDLEAAVHYGVRPITKRAASQNTQRFRACAPELYDALSGIVTDRARTVAEIRKRAILAGNTVFFEEPFELRSNTPLHERRRQREDWMEAALARTADCDVVFLDPDNGLEVASHGACSTFGPKYVTYEEVRRFFGREQSVIIYQHFDMESDLVGRRRAKLASRLKTDEARIQALHYHRGTARAFFVVPSAQHEKLLRDRIQSFLGSAWSEHFTRA